MAPVATCHHGRRGGTEAIEAWTAALRERGGDLFDADASLLGGPRMPNAAQQRLLLREGIGAPFWNSLTVTGKIEGRGRILAGHASFLICRRSSRAISRAWRSATSTRDCSRPMASTRAASPSAVSAGMT
jgi:hypothetical protein